MPRITLDLDSSLLAQLDREARRVGRTRSEFARQAIAATVESGDAKRLRQAIARAARAHGGEDPVALAEEALPTDNEALDLAERSRSRVRRRRG